MLQLKEYPKRLVRNIIFRWGFDMLIIVPHGILAFDHMPDKWCKGRDREHRITCSMFIDIQTHSHADETGSN